MWSLEDKQEFWILTTGGMSVYVMMGAGAENLGFKFIILYILFMFIPPLFFK